MKGYKMKYKQKRLQKGIVLSVKEKKRGKNGNDE